MTLKNAVIALDGSELAENAALAAAQMGILDRQSIHLVHVLETGTLASFADWVMSDDDRAKQFAAREINVLDSAERLLMEHETEVSNSKIVEGSPAEAIEDYASGVGSELIVVARRGLSELRRTFVGSVSQHLTEVAERPVLVIPEKVSGLDRIDRILATTDLSPESEIGLRTAADLALQLNAELVLSHAVAIFDVIPILPADPEVTPYIDFPAIAARLERDARKALEIKAQAFRDEGLQVQVAIKEGSPSNVIIETAEELKAGLVVIASHGRTGIRRFLLGSVATALLREVKCPLLIVPAVEPASESP